MKDRIYIKDWLKLKPYDSQTVTDIYYLKVCNDVKSILVNYKKSLQPYLTANESDTLACFLTSYLEDLVSDTNIWNTFVLTHKQLYNKQLPFYVLDEYYQEEINQQDISFLIWYFVNTIQNETFVAPFKGFIIELARDVMAIFDNVWEDAPSNNYLKTFYRIDHHEKDYYIARNLIHTVLFNTYLFYPDTSYKLQQKESELVEKNGNHENLLMLLKEDADSTLHQIHTQLLSLKGNEWVSKILGTSSSLSKAFLNISNKITGLFLYKKQDEHNVLIEHIASSRTFKLTKKSIDAANVFTKVDTILFLGIVSWMDEWWFSGVLVQQPNDPELILREKNSLQSKMQTNFLEYKSEQANKVLANQMNAFLSFTDGQQIVFMESKKVGDFYNNYTAYYNKSLNLTKKEIQEADKRLNMQGDFIAKSRIEADKYKHYAPGLIFFNPKGGLEMAFGVNSAFPVNNNPFFDIEDSRDHILYLLMSKEMSTELVRYCIDNCKSNLPIFNGDDGEHYLKDLDFLLRFWKIEGYHTKPAVTFSGTAEKK